MANYKLSYLETDIIHRCNLNCRGCSHFSPLCDKGTEQADINVFEQDLIRLSELFELDKLRLMGGEPLLRDDFMDFMLLAKKYFPSTHIELVTNGSLIEKLYPYLQVFKDNDFYLCVSMYHAGSVIDNVGTINTLKNILGNHFYTVEKGGMYNIGLDLACASSAAESYACCDSKFCTYFENGNIYICPVLGNFDRFCKYFAIKNNFKAEQYAINIHEHSAEEIVDFLNNQHSCCAVCKTNYRNINLHPWAVSKKEISEWICH